MANTYTPDNAFDGTKPGPGRPSGSRNIATRELRETLKEIVQMAATKENILGALEQVRAKSPDKYIQLLTRLIDLVLPKQQQVEITSEEGISFKDSLKQTVENAAQVKNE